MNIDKNQVLGLVNRMKSGDQEAFSDLYDQFAKQIYAYIRIKVSDQSLAEDILQEVFLKAWTGAKGLDVTNLNFSAWLYKVAGNTINDYYRKKYRQPPEVALEEARELAGQDDLAADASNRFEKESVKRVMASLPTHYKEVIELRFFQDFSIADTAKIMGKNSVTVRVWQHRALASLKKLFENYE